MECGGGLTYLCSLSVFILFIGVFLCNGKVFFVEVYSLWKECRQQCVGENVGNGYWTI